MQESEIQSQIEHDMAAIWKEVLGVREVDPNVSFLDLGGDSLAVTRCISRIRKAFGVALSLEVFFLADTSVRHLAFLVDQERKQLGM